MSRSAAPPGWDGTRRLSPVGYFALASLALATAAGINTASVALEQKGALLTRRFGSKAWCVHLAAITPAWAWFLLLLRGLGKRTVCPLPKKLRPFGVPLLMLATVTWLSAFLQLGLVRTLNGGVFGRGDSSPIRGGLFRWLRNPMYHSYTIALAGAGLRKGNALYLLLAAESFVLFNLIEAPVENRSVGRTSEN